jgi:hypothetical protein
MLPSNLSRLFAQLFDFSIAHSHPKRQSPLDIVNAQRYVNAVTNEERESARQLAKSCLELPVIDPVDGKQCARYVLDLLDVIDAIAPSARSAGLNQWIYDAVAADAAGRPAKALSFMAKGFDDLLCRGDFQVVDLILACDPEYLSTRLMVSALVMTRPARDHLPHYDEFRRRCGLAIVERDEMEPGLLDGL